MSSSKHKFPFSTIAEHREIERSEGINVRCLAQLTAAFKHAAGGSSVEDIQICVTDVRTGKCQRQNSSEMFAFWRSLRKSIQCLSQPKLANLALMLLERGENIERKMQRDFAVGQKGDVYSEFDCYPPMAQICYSIVKPLLKAIVCVAQNKNVDTSIQQHLVNLVFQLLEMFANCMKREEIVEICQMLWEVIEAEDCHIFEKQNMFKEQIAGEARCSEVLHEGHKALVDTHDKGSPSMPVAEEKTPVEEKKHEATEKMKIETPVIECEPNKELSMAKKELKEPEACEENESLKKSTPKKFEGETAEEARCNVVLHHGEEAVLDTHNTISDMYKEPAKSSVSPTNTYEQTMQKVLPNDGRQLNQCEGQITEEGRCSVLLPKKDEAVVDTHNITSDMYKEPAKSSSSLSSGNKASSLTVKEKHRISGQKSIEKPQKKSTPSKDPPTLKTKTNPYEEKEKQALSGRKTKKEPQKKSTLSKVILRKGSLSSDNETSSPIGEEKHAIGRKKPVKKTQGKTTLSKDSPTLKAKTNPYQEKEKQVLSARKTSKKPQKKGPLSKGPLSSNKESTFLNEEKKPEPRAKNKKTAQTESILKKDSLPKRAKEKANVLEKKKKDEASAQTEVERLESSSKKEESYAAKNETKKPGKACEACKENKALKERKTKKGLLSSGNETSSLTVKEKYGLSGQKSIKKSMLAEERTVALEKKKKDEAKTKNERSEIESAQNKSLSFPEEESLSKKEMKKPEACGENKTLKESTPRKVSSSENETSSLIAKEKHAKGGEKPMSKSQRKTTLSKETETRATSGRKANQEAQKSKLSKVILKKGSLPMAAGQTKNEILEINSSPNKSLSFPEREYLTKKEMKKPEVCKENKTLKDSTQTKGSLSSDNETSSPIAKEKHSMMKEKKDETSGQNNIKRSDMDSAPNKGSPPLEKKTSLLQETGQHVSIRGKPIKEAQKSRLRKGSLSSTDYKTTFLNEAKKAEGSLSSDNETSSPIAKEKHSMMKEKKDEASGQNNIERSGMDSAPNKGSLSSSNDHKTPFLKEAKKAEGSTPTNCEERTATLEEKKTDEVSDKRKIERLETENAQYKTKCSKMKRATEAKNEEINKQNKKIGEQQNQIQTLSAGNIKQDCIIKEKERINKEQQKKITEQGNENHILSRTNAEMHDMIQIRNETIAELRHENQINSSKCAELEHQIGIICHYIHNCLNPQLSPLQGMFFNRANEDP